MAIQQAAPVAVETISLRCPGDLTAEVEQWLTSGLIDSLPSMKMRELFAARLDMFRDADLITVAVDGGAVVGALSSRWSTLPSGSDFLHVTTQFVAETHRHGEVFRKSWRAHFSTLLGRGDAFPRLIVLKTYNPVVYCAMRSFTGASGVTMYPAIGASPGTSANASASANASGSAGAGLTEVAALIATAVAPGHDFEPSTGVLRSAGWPPDLYPRLPLSRDLAVNSYFAEHTRPGDRVLCVLDIPTTAGADMILHAFGVAA
jgi:hypothetical protein